MMHRRLTTAGIEVAPHYQLLVYKEILQPMVHMFIEDIDYYPGLVRITMAFYQVEFSLYQV